MVHHLANDTSHPNVYRMGGLAAAMGINILFIVPVPAIQTLDFRPQTPDYFR
jgi:hypothetical protein